MATYYSHKSTQSREIPYSFQCERCLQDSGPLTATIKGDEATYNSNHKALKEEEKRKLQQAAHKNLQQKIRTEYAKATDKQVFSTAFSGECPHCKQPQSWSIAGLKSDAASTPGILLLVGLVVAAGTYFTQGKNLLLSLVLGGICAAAAVVVYIAKSLSVGAKKQKTDSALQKNLPAIEWTAVQDLLEENR